MRNRLLTLACASGSCLLLLAACSNSKPVNEPDDEPNCGEVKEHRDQWRPREAQSDFLDIGKQAGIEWLSFYPQDQLDYPEYFVGLNRYQKRRVRLAPRGSDEQILIGFRLVGPNERLWPVDWYGTELMAVEAEGAYGWEMSVAIARASLSPREAVDAIANARVSSLRSKQLDAKESFTIDEGSVGTLSESTRIIRGAGPEYYYSARTLEGRTTSLLLIGECCQAPASGSGSNSNNDAQPLTFVEGALVTVLEGISIMRELALEGSPKHKCSSSLEEQLNGTLRFPDGTLQLSISNGQLVRKIGGDTTIQIDGEGAKPWILIRRLKESKTDGDIRARVRRDTTFLRRTKVPSSKFSAGYTPQEAKLPLVVFDYDDSSAENQLVGVLKAGNELLTFEVVTQGVSDGDARRAAKEAALKLLAGATGEPSSEAPELEPLIGWNVGTMGSND